MNTEKQLLDTWHDITEDDKPYILAELYESMTDAQKDQFLAETGNY